MEKIERILKCQRKRQGFSLCEAEEATKISIRYLRAIENGDFNAIPGGQFYLKGFLRMYGNYLHLDGDAVVKYYEDSLSEHLVSYEEKKALRMAAVSKKKNGFFHSIYNSLTSFMQL